MKSKIQRCNSTTNLRRLWQMVGMWQIDEEEIRKKHFSIKNLGVCYTHFIRGKNCVYHSYMVMGKNIQVPCIGQKKCGALQELHPLVISIESNVKEDPNCDNISHHKNDTKEALEAIGYWILNVAPSEKLMWQKKVLMHLVYTINQLNQEKSDNTLDISLLVNTKTEVPSLFIILIILVLTKFNYDS
ncbi:hypothetical protein C1645_833374, partial [Glomus cerebriforme]